MDNEHTGWWVPQENHPILKLSRENKVIYPPFVVQYRELTPAEVIEKRTAETEIEKEKE